MLGLPLVSLLLGTRDLSLKVLSLDVDLAQPGGHLSVSFTGQRRWIETARQLDVLLGRLLEIFLGFIELFL